MLKLCKLFSVDCNINSEQLNKAKNSIFVLPNKNKQKLLKELKISTFNVRTFNDIGKKYQMAQLAQKHNIDIIGIQEHRLNIPPETKIHCEYIKGTEYLFIYSSAVNGIGGTGLIIKSIYLSRIKNIINISPRIISVTLTSNPNITIISVYSPTNMADENKIHEFYNDLDDYIKTIPVHNVIVIVGDFNARIGRNNNSIQKNKYFGIHTYSDETNENGSHLIDFCLSNNLTHLPSRFPHKPNHQWTWQHPNGFKAQLDHILCCNKWKNSIKDCRAHASMIDSDHRSMTVIFKLSLRCNNKSYSSSSKKTQYDWSLLKDNKILQNKYKNEINNRFALLDEINNDDPINNSLDIQKKYTKIINVIEESNRIIPIKKNYPHWISNKTKKLITSELDSNYCSSVRVINENLTQNELHKKEKLRHQLIKKQIEKSLELDKITFIENTCTSIENNMNTNNLGIVYKTINMLTGNYSNRIPLIKQSKDEDIIITWMNYFKDLLNNNHNIDNLDIFERNLDLDININDFTLHELNQVISTLKNGRKPGIDNINSEVLKYGGNTLREKILCICNLSFNNNITPIEWKKNIIIPIPKKGDRCNINNYRGITLMSIVAKIYNKMILNRIYDKLNPLLRINQAGFRKNMSTIDQIHIIRRIIEGAKEKNLPLIITFIDFKKAFDSIDRNIIFKILRFYGIPIKIVNAIKILYDNTVSCVNINNQQSEYFKINTGVLQGDTLAPFIFIVVLNFVLERSQQEDFGFTTSINQKLTDLDFADDIALLDDNINTAILHFNKIKTEAERVGLQINNEKTKYITYNIENIIEEFDKINIKKVKNFCYLGANIDDTLADVRNRIQKAWTIFWKLRKIWQNNNISLETKIKIHKALCISVLLYNCETWILNKKISHMLNVFGTKSYRFILNIKYNEKISNDKIYEKIKTKPICEIIADRQIKFIIKKINNIGSLISEYSLYTPNHGKRKRGRPKMRYLEYFTNLVNIRNFVPEGIG